MTELVTIVLPSGQDLLDRLRRVKGSGHAASRLHPIIVREIGGKRLTGFEIVRKLLGVFRLYAAGSREVFTPLVIALPEYLEAIVDDDEVRQDAQAAVKQWRQLG